MDEDQIKSRYEPLSVPDFKSSIPSHLLGKLTDQERYLVETLSKMEQQNSWLILACLKANNAIINLDTRQSKVELWKERLTSKWALVIGGLLMLSPVVLKAIVEHFLKKGP